MPKNLLHTEDADLLNIWLSWFVLETRTQYTHLPHYELLTGILRPTRSSNPQAPNFLNKKTHHLNPYRELSIVISETTRVKKWESRSADDETLQWRSGVLGSENPEGLVFFYNGKNFCLHGGEEHKGLKPSQLEH